MEEERLYGGQLQTFEALRDENCVYVDKTEYVYKMTHKYRRVFLSRPRRFGKSLLCSTLRSYFEGRKELFKGLAIEKLEKDWTKYPVFLFDMSTGKHKDKDALEHHLGEKLSKYEEKYNITASSPYNNDRLIKIIETAYAQENKKVVIIIDEYDAPLLDVIHEEENLPPLRHVMRNFYSPLKACDEYIHFIFLTGITKFSQLSIFSELNNIRNISMLPEYAAICGITEEELLTQLSPDIDDMAVALNETREKTIAELKKLYDGYHFTWPSPDIYNPFSLINAFADKRRKPFWFSTGTPTYVVEMLRKFSVLPIEIGERKASEASFDAPTETMTDITPLLYQSGYLTIKDYDPDSDLYTLDFPNKEVREGLIKYLLPYLVSSKKREVADTTFHEMQGLIVKDRMDEALEMLKTFLLSIPYVNFLTGETEPSPNDAALTNFTPTKDFSHYEGHYQQLLYVIFTFLGCRTEAEVRNARARLDLSLETRTRIYVIEIKLNQPAENALKQINENNYVAKYTLQHLPIYKLAISFSTKTRTLNDWILQPA